MKIFVIGLGRTGTKSLTQALNILGFNILHYPLDEKLYNELLNANYRFSLLENHDGISDITVAPYYAQLYHFYPDSKFILTIRDKYSWLNSMKKHWSEKKDNKSEPLYDLHMKFRFFLRIAVYGCIKYSEERLSYVYDLHNTNVIKFFKDKENCLLIMNITAGDGWQKLCKYLNCDVPQEAFPHNSK